MRCRQVTTRENLFTEILHLRNTVARAVWQSIRMGHFRTFSTVPILFSLSLAPAFAHSYGPAPRVTGAPGDNPKACTQCHTTTPLNGGPGSVSVSLQSGPVYIPGVKQRVTVTVSDVAQQRWGFELSARLNSDTLNGQAGKLVPVDNLTQVICEDAGPEPCLSGVSFIQHTSAGTRNGIKNGASFQFDWIPPSTNAGPVTFFVAGNAANGDGTSGGDHIYTSSVQLNPLTPVAPAISTNGVVSAATLSAGPVSPNSWISVFGTNLTATTRSWQDSDFVNGAFPSSLDGTSVILTANGAARRAYIGYVSPSQVNVLLPSDTSATTVQVQVKNPAGVTAQSPVTVQANAPQLLTVDGTYILATHADGTAVGKPGLTSGLATTPAAPLETITIFATGCGPTNPALIPGQLPVQANGLITLPQFTVASNPASVISGGIMAGAGGVYQIKIQIPANAANGDSTVVASLGTNASASALITIQR
jgi:uncharacterized protein (TIGR03437 family)